MIIKVGIDLGTTNSEIAFINEGGNIEVIENEQNMKFTPSAVHIEDREITVGSWAKERLQDNPENVAVEFKRCMGDGTWSFPFKSGKKLSAKELSAEVLKSLLVDAKRRIGRRPVAAVITVPEGFEDPQKKDTIEAGKMVGLIGVELLKEPLAACYAFNRSLSPERRPSEIVYWLVYDLGGGTFDAALVRIEGGVFTVITHEGDLKLGG
ncbi:MAG TPA: Hsp70 family protein [Candidatus Omnitrophica bacterium]|nr:Hsp70 family protein [Candidatus Omnitrophota bacterium]